MIVSVSTTTKLYSNFLLRSSTISATDNKFRSSLYSTIRTGVVTKYDPVKKWGFIRPDNGATDVYVHQTAIYADGFRMLNVRLCFYLYFLLQYLVVLIFSTLHVAFYACPSPCMAFSFFLDVKGLDSSTTVHLATKFLIKADKV
jgi:'Cold-shock' DNA-binding domain